MSRREDTVRDEMAKEISKLLEEIAALRQRAEDAEARTHSAQNSIEALQADLDAAWGAANVPVRTLVVSLAEVIATFKHERNEAQTTAFALKNKIAKVRALLAEPEKHQ